MTSRTLSFPSDRRVGDLMFTLDGARKTVPARGEVDVPTDTQVMLLLMPNPTNPDAASADDGFVAGDLAPLADLGSDDLHGVFAEGVVPGALRHVIHLTGLKVAGFSGAFDDDEMAPVAALPGLTTCSLSSETATGTGTAPLTGRESLSMVSLNLPAMTAEGAAVVCGINSSMLAINGPDLTADLLDAMDAMAAPTVSMSGPTVDREAFLRLLERSPAVTSITCHATAAGEPVIDPDTELQLRTARPDLSIDGSWLAPKAVAKLAAARAAKA